MTIRISDLNRLFDLSETVYYRSYLYERLYTNRADRLKNCPIHKYRVIFSDDDYDYVTEVALKKRLDRVFARLDKEKKR